MTSKKFNLLKIKKILLKKGYKIQKNSSFKNLQNYKSFNFTILTSIFLISFLELCLQLSTFLQNFFLVHLTVENNSKLKL